MNFSDNNSFETFESFEMDNFFRESLDDVASKGSSFSESFDDIIPVYRSLDVMPNEMMFFESQTGLDKVYEPPTLSRSSRIHDDVGLSSDFLCDVDLFSMLETELQPSGIPHEDMELCGISATTSFTLHISVESVTSEIISFLESRHIHFDFAPHCLTWKCESKNSSESCKFRVQVYATALASEFTVEFLRLSGSPLLFSNFFRTIKSQLLTPSEAVTEVVVTQKLEAVVPADVSDTQKSVEAIVSWASSDLPEATRVVSNLLSNSALWTSPTPDVLGPVDIMTLTLLGSICVKCKEEQSVTVDQLPMLSLLDLLLKARASAPRGSVMHSVLSTLIDSLIPMTARLSLSQQASDVVRETATSLMEMSV